MGDVTRGNTNHAQSPIVFGETLCAGISSVCYHTVMQCYSEEHNRVNLVDKLYQIKQDIIHF